MTLPTTHNALLTLLFTATGALLKGLKCSSLIKQCSFTKRSSLKSQRSIWRSLYASPWLADPIWYWSTTKFSTKYFFPPNVCSTLLKPDWSIPYFLLYQRHLSLEHSECPKSPFPLQTNFIQPISKVLRYQNCRRTIPSIFLKENDDLLQKSHCSHN